MWRHITSSSCVVYTTELIVTLLPTVVHITALMLHITAVSAQYIKQTPVTNCSVPVAVLHHAVVTTACLLHHFSAIVLFSWHDIPQWAMAVSYLRLHDHTDLDTPHSVGLIWMSDQPNAYTSLPNNNTYHSQ